MALVSQLLTKHQEQKEAFLKACTLARRTAETFLKYSSRCVQYYSSKREINYKGPENKVKGTNMLKILFICSLNYWYTYKEIYNCTFTNLVILFVHF